MRRRERKREMGRGRWREKNYQREIGMTDKTRSQRSERTERACDSVAEMVAQTRSE